MQLYNYQKTGVSFLKQRPKALLADPMGAGKSAQAIVAAKELGLSRILVICPASVKYNWQKEIGKWNSKATTFIVEGGKSQILKANYTIINYDLLAAKPLFIQLISRHYDLIIADEAHYIKNNRAKRTKCVYYPRGLKDRTDRLWLLTGTPVLNRPVELYSHLKALTPEKMGVYSSYLKFCQRFCAAYEGKWGWDVTGASNVPELSRMLEGFMLRRNKKDILPELPPVTYQTIDLPITKAQIKLNDKERGEYEKQEGILGELASVRRQTGLAKVNSMVDHIQDILEDKQKVAIFAYHRDVISALKEGLKEYLPLELTGATPAIKRKQAIDKFRTTVDNRVFIGQIQAAGVGIDGLQEVCDMIVFAEMTWVPGQMHQAVGRLDRIGQKNPVLVQFLVTPGSIDEDIADSIARKEKVIEVLIKPTKTEPQTEKETEMKVFLVKTIVNVEAEGLDVAVANVTEALKSVNAEIVELYSSPTANITNAAVPAPQAPVVDLRKDKPKAAKPKAKTKPKAEEVVEVTPGAPTELPGSEEMDGPGLMRYCNGKLGALGKEARTAKIKEVVEMFRADFGIEAVRDMPVAKVAEAKTKFDAMMAV